MKTAGWPLRGARGTKNTKILKTIIRNYYNSDPPHLPTKHIVCIYVYMCKYRAVCSDYWCNPKAASIAKNCDFVILQDVQS